MTGRLTTHVLDTARGRPGAGMTVELYSLLPARRWLKTIVTNRDGRCEAPLLEGEALEAGVYELVFKAGEYFRLAGEAVPSPAFLEEIPIRFGVARPDAHYHVPLLVSPYGYTTYRGS
jgi:5-hydroxyisourate hydrolase